MRICSHLRAGRGYTLIELLLVLALLVSCAAVAALSVGVALGRNQARAAAQSWQAAIAWSQVGALWQGGVVDLRYEKGVVQAAHGFSLCGGGISCSAPSVPVDTNLNRWLRPDGIRLGLGGTFASPDGGGSFYFEAPSSRYRVVVRPESGLTSRSLLSGP